jgi:tetratricopeptide (TPR) repeat protein
MKKTDLDSVLIAVFVLCGLASFAWLMQSGNPKESRDARHVFWLQEEKAKIKDEATIKEVEVLTYQASKELQAKNYGAASDYLQRAAKIDKNNQTVLFFLGNIFFEWKDYKKAIKFFKQALKAGGAYDGQIYAFIGAAYHNLEQYKNALKAYSEYIKKHPDSADPAIYISRGVVLCKLGRYKEAIADFNMIPERYAEIALYNLTEAYILDGNLEEALAHLNKYLSVASWILSDDFDVWTKALDKSKNRDSAAKIKALMEGLTKKERQEVE